MGALLLLHGVCLVEWGERDDLRDAVAEMLRRYAGADRRVRALTD